MIFKGKPAGKVAIVVDLLDQHAYLSKGGQVVLTAPVSTGREGYDTPAGNYQVIQKDIDHRSSIYGAYVRDGTIVQENVDVRKDSASARFDLCRRFDALFPPDCRRSRSSRRLFARLPGLARMHPHAGIQGEAILRRGKRGYARDRQTIKAWSFRFVSGCVGQKA